MGLILVAGKKSNVMGERPSWPPGLLFDRVARVSGLISSEPGALNVVVLSQARPIRGDLTALAEPISRD
jgi:hypothetical protein